MCAWQIETAVTFSVVICAYTQERWDDILAAVESVRRQTVTAREVILVVDDNPDLYARLGQTLPDTLVVENRFQRGLSGARNTGLALATADVVAFLDDDAAADPDWLAWLAHGYADPRVVGVGGAPVPGWQTGRPGWFPDELAWVVGCAYRGLPARPAPVRNLIGANMSLRREALVAVGGFSRGVGRVGGRLVHCEDTELCIRVGQSRPDGVILYEPRARVLHRVPAGRATWAYFRVRCYTEGQSKALVSRLVGARAGLSSERSYALRVLPRGVLAGLWAGLRGDPDGFRRAGAIVAGFGLTAAGYLVGRVGGALAAPGARPAENVGAA